MGACDAKGTHSGIDRNSLADQFGANALLGMRLPYAIATDWTPDAMLAALERTLNDVGTTMPGADLREGQTAICEKAVAFLIRFDWAVECWQKQNPRRAANTQRTARPGNIKSVRPAQQRSRAKGAIAKTA